MTSIGRQCMQVIFDLDDIGAEAEEAVDTHTLAHTQTHTQSAAHLRAHIRACSRMPCQGVPWRATPLHALPFYAILMLSCALRLPRSTHAWTNRDPSALHVLHVPPRITQAPGPIPGWPPGSSSCSAQISHWYRTGSGGGRVGVGEAGSHGRQLAVLGSGTGPNQCFRHFAACFASRPGLIRATS